MRQILAIALSVLLAAPAVADPMPRKGERAPDVLGTTADGTALEVPQFKGKVLVVTFWASWCGPCMHELPMLESLQRLAGKDRLRVVAVNIEEMAVFRKISRKLESFELTVAHDDRKRGSDAYGVHGIPHMVIIGRDGTILKVNRGYSESALDSILAEINAALAAPVSASATPS